MKTKVPKSDEKLQKKIVTDSWNTYILEASIWTPETKSEWAITKIDTTWNVKFPLWTDWVPTYAFKFLPADVLTLTYNYEVDIITPTKTSESFNFNLINTAFTWSMTFSEKVILLSVAINWWTISYTSWNWTNILNFSWISSNSTNAIITVTIQDIYWNTSTITSNTYPLVAWTPYSSLGWVWIEPVHNGWPFTFRLLWGNWDIDLLNTSVTSLHWWVISNITKTWADEISFMYQTWAQIGDEIRVAWFDTLWVPFTVDSWLFYY